MEGQCASHEKGGEEPQVSQNVHPTLCGPQVVGTVRLPDVRT